MPDRATIEEFLGQRHIAVVGVSRDPRQFANTVYRDLKKRGYDLYPVNPHADVIEGDPCYARVTQVPDPLDGVLVMVNARSALEVVEQCANRGVRRIWLHRGVGRGSVNDEAVALCRRRGIAVVDGACPLMFTDPPRGVHRFHRLLSGRRIAA